MTKVLQFSRQFYQKHNLSGFIHALPKEIQLSQQLGDKLEKALRQGFDQAMVLPPVGLQNQCINKLAELGSKKIRELDDNDPDQIAGSVFFEDEGQANDVKKAVSQNHSRNKPYILLYQSEGIPLETKGKTLNQLDRLFYQKKWNGLTVTEYLILQRREFEARRNHSFDEYFDDPRRSQWSWLLDSRIPGENASGEKAINASWRPEFRRICVWWHERDDQQFSFSELGARPVIVIEF